MRQGGDRCGNYCGAGHSGPIVAGQAGRIDSYDKVKDESHMVAAFMGMLRRPVLLW
ncbi:hypothetical protein Namu_1724 [Nakamurella multipartita DSM 44233]|uniref:Uncharacterized protein n=1 Tax=Nakamurella multipartita (strain ATCC 700099 / DSM 44233 / CIP 104796 / JCM 9543 / NBRC 105858 / Y-104) TaxID=479431 RepID=C8XG03_NAKMY|nr:hypothetical protein Namu_1724 [Nakamurella multipartita DSM 44233]